MQRDFQKSITRRSVRSKESPRPYISFTFPMHKAHRFFEGSTVVLEQLVTHLLGLPGIPRSAIWSVSELWLKSDERVPTRSWFINRLKVVLPDEDIAAHSLRSGGANSSCTSWRTFGIGSKLLGAVHRTRFSSTSVKILSRSKVHLLGIRRWTGLALDHLVKPPFSHQPPYDGSAPCLARRIKHLALGPFPLRKRLEESITQSQ